MVPRSALIASLNCRTRRAKPSHRKPGAEEFETKAFSRISACLKDCFTFKFFRAPAGNTNEVVMIMVIIGGQLKTLATFWQLQLPQEIHGCEQPERPVDGGQRNPGISPEQLLMHVLSAEVMTSPCALKQVQHPLALRRQALTSAMEVLAKIAGDGHNSGTRTCS